MKFIQTYFNNLSHSEIANAQTKFHSPEIHWLSVAYSCLLIKKNHPNIPLHLYGNDSVIDLLINKFRLPYDKFFILENIPQDREKYYCWPKIEVYKLQEEPFIHIDNDIFIWEPLPDTILCANLVAQHKENDSKFYIRILNHLRNSNVILPNVIEKYLTEDYVISYNAGLIGGNNVSFFKEYTKEIDAFLDQNRIALETISQMFLLNVVFEQWMYYALTTKTNQNVQTYYKDTVVDFLLTGTREPYLAIEGKNAKYLHLMDYKRQYSCNRLVVRNMLEEFPEYFNRILTICKDCGVSLMVKYNGKDIYNPTLQCEIVYQNHKSYAYAIKELGSYNYEDLRNTSYVVNQLDRIKYEIFIKLHRIDLLKEELLKLCHSDYMQVLQFQREQKNRLDTITEPNYSIEMLTIEISPFAKVSIIEDDIKSYIVNSADLERKPRELQILYVYNALFDKVDEFIYANLDSTLLDIFKEKVRLSDIFKRITDDDLRTRIKRFIIQGIFDNILYITN